MGDSQDLTDRVRALVARERAMPPSKVLLTSRLEEDLGMTGDDSAEFLEAFAEEFGVDLSGLDFHVHFGPEGCNPFWLFSTPAWLKDYGKYAVTVDHIVRVAEVGRWFSPPFVGSALDGGWHWQRSLGATGGITPVLRVGIQDTGGIPPVPPVRGDTDGVRGP